MQFKNICFYGTCPECVKATALSILRASALTEPMSILNILNLQIISRIYSADYIKEIDVRHKEY